MQPFAMDEHDAAATPKSRAAHMVRWQVSLPTEHGFVPLRVEGTLPDDLRGTLYRNGPSAYECFGEPYRHLFDGDGAVTAVHMDGGRAQGACRYVQSRGRQEERRAGRRIHGAGLTPATRWWRRLGARGEKNLANTNVLWWNQRLFALYEGNVPTELSPTDLSTLGETDLGGTIPQLFSAHPHYVPARRAFYNFGLRYGRRTLLDLFELRDDGARRRLASLPVADFTIFLHDFAATPNYLVFFIPPVRMKPLAPLLGLRPPLEAMRYEPARGTEVVVVPIDEPERPRRFHIDAFFQYHFANAFERDGKLVLDFPHFAGFPYADLAREASGSCSDFTLQGQTPLTMRRAELDPATERVELTTLSEAPLELPTVHPARAGLPHRFVYLLAEDPAEGTPSRIGKLDVETGHLQTLDLGAARFPSESLFVPRPSASREDDGYLLSLVYDGEVHRSHVAVLDAADLDRGPLARLWFDHHIPFTLHGTFVP